MKTVLITGGSEGLGFAIAKLLSKNNTVYLLARNEDKLNTASKELNCNYKVCDVSIWEDVQKVVDEVINETGKIDVLINNAGLWVQGPIEENDPERIKDVINVNTLGPIYMTKAVVPIMKQQKSGIILNINSQAGLYGKAERSVYHASKWALTGFAKCMSQELQKHNIKVMSIHPAGMKTKFFEKAGIEKNQENMLDVNEVARTVEFMLNQGEYTVFPEVGMVNVKY